MSVDPLQPIRIEPTPAVRPVRQRGQERDGEPRRRFDGDGEPEQEEGEPDDGLPHVDVRA